MKVAFTECNNNFGSAGSREAQQNSRKTNDFCIWVKEKLSITLGKVNLKILYSYFHFLTNNFVGSADKRDTGIFVLHVMEATKSDEL